MVNLVPTETKVVHVLTTSEQSDKIPVTNGLLILCTDSGDMYFDYNDVRKRIVAEASEDSLGDLLTEAVSEISFSNNILTVTKSDGTTSTYSLTEMSGATTSAAGKSGLVPAPAVGDNTKFLRGDGTWATSKIYEDAKENGYSESENTFWEQFLMLMSITDGDEVNY